MTNEISTDSNEKNVNVVTKRLNKILETRLDNDKVSNINIVN